MHLSSNRHPYMHTCRCVHPVLHTKAKHNWENIVIHICIYSHACVDVYTYIYVHMYFMFLGCSRLCRLRGGNLQQRAAAAQQQQLPRAISSAPLIGALMLYMHIVCIASLCIHTRTNLSRTSTFVSACMYVCMCLYVLMQHLLFSENCGYAT